MLSTKSKEQEHSMEELGSMGVWTMGVGFETSGSSEHLQLPTRCTRQCGLSKARLKTLGNCSRWNRCEVSPWEPFVEEDWWCTCFALTCRSRHCGFAILLKSHQMKFVLLVRKKESKKLWKNGKVDFFSSKSPWPKITKTDVFWA